MSEPMAFGFPAKLFLPWELEGNVPKLCFWIQNKEIVDILKSKFALINFSEEFGVKKPNFYHEYNKDYVPFMISYKKDGVITILAATFVYGKKLYSYKGEVFVQFYIKTDLPFLEVLHRLTGYSNKDLDLNEIRFEEPHPVKNEERLRNAFYDWHPFVYFRIFASKIHPDKDTSIFLVCSKFNVEHYRLTKLCFQYNSDNSNPDYIQLDIDDAFKYEWEKKNNPNQENRQWLITRYFKEISSKVYAFFNGYSTIENQPATPAQLSSEENH